MQLIISGTPRDNNKNSNRVFASFKNVDSFIIIMLFLAVIISIEYDSTRSQSYSTHKECDWPMLLARRIRRMLLRIHIRSISINWKIYSTRIDNTNIGSSFMFENKILKTLTFLNNIYISSANNSSKTDYNVRVMRYCFNILKKIIIEFYCNNCRLVFAIAAANIINYCIILLN